MKKNVIEQFQGRLQEFEAEKMKKKQEIEAKDKDLQIANEKLRIQKELEISQRRELEHMTNVLKMKTKEKEEFIQRKNRNREILRYLHNIIQEIKGKFNFKSSFSLFNRKYKSVL